MNFNDFGDFALEIRFAYFVQPGSHFRNTISAVNLEILRKFNGEGLEFAFPTQTIYTLPGAPAGPDRPAAVE